MQMFALNQQMLPIYLNVNFALETISRIGKVYFVKIRYRILDLLVFQRMYEKSSVLHSTIFINYAV
jgi:hypothetical protein